MTRQFCSVENENAAEADERLTVGLLDGRTVRHLQERKTFRDLNNGTVFSVDLVCKEELNLMLKVSDF